MIENDDMVTILGSIHQAGADQLKLITDAIRVQRDRLSQQVKNTFRVGDRVIFTAKGVEHHGEVKKIMKKNIRVETDHAGSWTVFPAFLSEEGDIIFP